MITVKPSFSYFIIAQDETTRYFFSKIVEKNVKNKDSCERAVLRCFRQCYPEMYTILYDMMVLDNRRPLNTKIDVYLGQIGYEEFFSKLVESLDNRWYYPYLEMIVFGYLKDIERTWYQWRYKVRIQDDLQLYKLKQALAMSYMAGYNLAK
jgi:hypothetical protein